MVLTVIFFENNPYSSTPRIDYERQYFREIPQELGADMDTLTTADKTGQGQVTKETASRTPSRAQILSETIISHERFMNSHSQAFLRSSTSLSAEELAKALQTVCVAVTDGEECSSTLLAVSDGSLYFACEYNHEFENYLQLEAILKRIVWCLYSMTKVYTEPPGSKGHQERITHILNKYLPLGKIMFMNRRMIRQLDSQLEADLKSF